MEDNSNNERTIIRRDNKKLVAQSSNNVIADINTKTKTKTVNQKPLSLELINSEDENIQSEM